MSFDPTVNLMVLISAGAAVVGVVGWLFTLHSGHSNLKDAVKGQQVLIEAAATRFVTLEVKVANECVKKDDIERMEDRLTKRLDTVEHVIRNTMAQMISVVTARGRAEDRA